MIDADFSHCEHIPDSVVESTRVKQLLDKAKYNGICFKIPSRKKLDVRFLKFVSYCIHGKIYLGELLDINFWSIMSSIKG